jgi:hypothetical protein
MHFEADMEAVPLTPEQSADLLATALERAAAAVAEARSVTDPADLFCVLPDAAIGAFRLGLYAEANDFAGKCLALASEYRTTWNFGNAIHLAHTTLGLLALESGNVEAAAEQLQLAGETPGSPQLNSFGPTMQLAHALLERGLVAPVLAYLTQCRKFWKLGGVWLDLWEQKIQAGAVPSFTMNLYR